MLEVRDMPPERRPRKRRQEWWIVGGVLAVLAGVLAFAAWDVVDTPAGGPQPVAKPQAASEAGTQVKPPVVVDDLIDDDGKTLWVSPTHGPPLDLAYLPPGVEVVLALRPAHLMAHPEGDKIVAALGPLGTQAIESLERSAGAKFAAIDRLVVGWQFARDGSPAATFVVTTASALAASSDNYQPKSEEGRVTVIGPPSALEEVRTLDGRTPPLSRDVNRALSHTNSSRDVTLLFRPRMMLSDASSPLTGAMASLRSPLESFYGDNVAAAVLSMNWNEDFFIELVAVPTLDSSPEKTSLLLSQMIGELPIQIENVVLELQSSPHSRRVVARLPEMVRRMAAYTRHGFDRDAAILRCYLPVTAGHNLIMGAELALAEAQGGGAERNVTRPVAEATSPGSITERLQRKTSLRFDREELEAALDMLAQDLGVPIEIRGPDLQADGITRNQLFAIDMADRTGDEILVEILRRANPDKLATGPPDPRQKLVYVVGAEAIVITTRSQAAARGEPLPPVFSAE